MAKIKFKKLNLGLLGRRYKDEIFYLKKIKPGETNEAESPRESLGGIYNISRNEVSGVKYHEFIRGSTSALIISESANSTRTSIVYNKQNQPQDPICYHKINWLHIAYVDDTKEMDTIDTDKCPVSADFCTRSNRSKFLTTIKGCEIIFDSRERKSLYQNIDTSTPIILHDKYGCECIVNQRVSHEQKIKPIDGLHVNGAGDIFAGLFITNYYNKSLSYAINQTPQQTKEYIISNEI